MQDWLGDNLWAAWLGIALVLGVVEAVTVDFVFLMLAGGALVGAVAALTPLGPAGQVVAAGIAAVGLLGVVRPVAKRHIAAHTPKGALGVDRYLGRRVLLTDEVTERAGFVVLDGDTWSARVEDGEPSIPGGTEASVAQVRGATLVLHPVAPLRDVIDREERP